MAKNYKSMRGVSIDLGKLMTQSEKSITIGNTKTNARGDQLGRAGRVVKSADEIAREHYNRNNPRAVKQTSIKMDDELIKKTIEEAKQKTPVDDWKEPVSKTMTEQEEYANAGISKEEAEKTAPVDPEPQVSEKEVAETAKAMVDAAEEKAIEEAEEDDWVEDADGNFVRKSELVEKTPAKKKSTRKKKS